MLKDTITLLLQIRVSHFSVPLAGELTLTWLLLMGSINIYSNCTVYTLISEMSIVDVIFKTFICKWSFIFIM